ncbi:hypothetical protein FQN50_003100 [Emmonsiellopsis sp. PD_5]|nr:hypothetical protein FQN50_003100 [Emmonsiellopsis sp. PD_5]
MAESVGYKKELDAAVRGLREMHRRGIVVLPGGTYVRDLEHFEKLLGFTAHESIIAATAGVAKLFMRGHELGKIQPDIAILQDHGKLNVFMINGRVHKASWKDDAGSNADFPEVKKTYQKQY